MCRICYKTKEGTDFDVSGTSSNAGKIGAMSMCCGYGDMGDNNDLVKYTFQQQSPYAYLNDFKLGL